MNEDTSETTRSGWSFWLEKTSQSLKRAWVFANEFDLIEKTKENWPKIKAYGAATMLFLSSFSLKANTPERETSVPDGIRKEVKAPSSTPNEKDDKVSALDFSNAAEFRAYPGKYYNEICNGSPCWLSSTFETNGAGIGKNVSSVATWNNHGDYRGLNQMSPGHASKFLKWLETQEEHKNVYQALKKGGVGKANWQAVAKKMEHQMTVAFEDYMVEKYSPENFQAIQKKLNEAGSKASIKKLHPVILSAIHQLTVQRPAWRNKIAMKMISFMKRHKGDESQLNSAEFINELYPPQAGKDHYAALRKRAVATLNDTTINWKQEQFANLLALATPANDDTRSWFDLQEEKKAAILQAEKAKRKIKKLSKDDMLAGTLLPQTKLKLPTNLELKKINIAEKQTKGKKATKVAQPKKQDKKKDLYSEALRNKKFGRDV